MANASNEATSGVKSAADIAGSQTEFGLGFEYACLLLDLIPPAYMA